MNARPTRGMLSRVGKGGRQNHIDSEFVKLPVELVEQIALSRDEPPERRKRAVRHLKALGVRNAAKRER